MSDLLPRIKQPIVCANCHDPKTMNLRVINPAFIEAMEKRGIDVKKASREEMRSYVCGQCHVEYYFVPADKKVVLPWVNGLHPEKIYEYYSMIPNGFEMDWKHPDSEAKMLKAQHPEFEILERGRTRDLRRVLRRLPHALYEGGRAEVHLALGHEPHEAQPGRPAGPATPRAIQWLLERVKTMQARVWEMQRMAGEIVAKAHLAIGKASKDAKANKAELDKARELIRKAQWYWDFVAAENSMGFHNPTMVLTTLGRSVDLAHQAIAMAGKASGGR